nr:hypothetical protein [Tanacetum cinerariifolium]
MLVQQQAAVDIDDVVTDNVPINDVAADDVPATDAEPTPPSLPPTTTPPPPQELPSTSQVIPTPPPSPIAPSSSPPQQQQPSQPTTISMDLLNNLLETSTVLTRIVENLEQDKIAQALEIIKLKKRVRKLEKKRKLKVFGLKRLRKEGIIAYLDADKDVTLEDVEVEKNADVQGRQEESQAKVYHIDLEHADKVLSMQDDEPEPAELQEPDIEAQVWKNQRGIHGLAKVKSWRLLESCGVHIITFTTTQMILLVKRRYPLTRFTLEQMLNNVRLGVEEESEMSLELLRFVRQQQQEGYRPE